MSLKRAQQLIDDGVSRRLRVSMAETKKDLRLTRALVNSNADSFEIGNEPKVGFAYAGEYREEDEQELNLGDAFLGDFTGANFYWNAENGRLEFRYQSTITAYIDASTGVITAGGGAVTIGTAGLSIVLTDTGGMVHPGPAYNISWTDGSNSVTVDAWAASLGPYVSVIGSWQISSGGPDIGITLVSTDNGTGNITLGNSAGGVNIDATGNFTLYGTGTVWDDLPPNVVSFGLGAAAPSFSTYNGNLRAYEFVGVTTTKEIFMDWQLPHSWKEGSSIQPHIHLYIPNNTGSTAVVKFYLEYTWTNYDAVEGSTTTTSGTYSVTNGAGNMHRILSFGSIAGTGKNRSSIFQARIYRDPADAADTYATSVWLKSADIHVEMDSLGEASAP